ncbi:MAG: N-acetylneuraminate synthase [Desulfarculaceae bacterium]
MVRSLNIGGRLVGPDQPCFIIAEAGVNHNGDLSRALAMVEAASEAGADAVKFQTFDPEDLATSQAPLAQYQKAASNAKSQKEMLQGLTLSPDDFHSLAGHCQGKGMIFLSTPFDTASLDLLLSLSIPAIKIASGEVTNLPFLAEAGGKGIPVILSTGMANLVEVEVAVNALTDAGCRDLALLHCVSRYPAVPAEANLRAMLTLGQRFHRPVGYSDHTLGPEVALAAAALGACIIEKHFTLDRGLPGPDHQASAIPDELAALVAGVRKVEAALGHGRKEPAPSEAETARAARRSLVAAVDIAAGSELRPDMLTSKRPGTGIPPSRASEVVGRRTARDIPAGTILGLEMLL